MSRSAWRDERGFAMVTVLGISAMITALSIGAFFVGQQTMHDSVRNRGETKAFQVASSGMDLELATFDPRNLTTGRYPHGGTTPDGAYLLTVQQLDAFEYILTSVGSSENSSETIVQRFFYLDLWDMNMGAGESASLGGGSAWNGNANITGPFYIRGNLEWSGNAKVEGGPLFIKDGHLNNSGSGSFGEAKPMKMYITGTPPVIGKTHNVRADGPIRSSVPDIVLPWVDDSYMDAAVFKSREESVDNRMGGSASTLVNTESVGVDASTYTTVIPGRVRAATSPASSSLHYKYRGDATRAGLGAGSKSLTIGGSSFGAWPGNGYPTGSGRYDDFAYNAAAGTLYVNGTVYVDGPVTIGANVNNYVGNGTIVANGNVLILGDLRPRDGLSISNCLGIVTPGDVTLSRETMTGAIFCNGTFLLDKPGTVYTGTVLAGRISATSPNISLHNNPLISDVLPEAMPGSGGGLVFPGTWSRR